MESGDLSAPAPPIRESKYLSREQCIEIYRWMLLNRRMETALENLYKQGKVVGGVYFGLGQEACSCASAYALGKDDWMGPMIRNQGALLVRGFRPADIMMQYMAKSGSPTGGRDTTSHFGDLEKRNVVAPISMLGDLIPVLAGVALGARLQGKHIAVMTYIGDGGQSTGVTYEGLNFAAVQNLGLVLIVENNLWAYSTPADMQFRVEDLAERAIGYGIPGVIVDGTDACQVYDACHEACERARRGEGPTLIEAKMMRMKGHAIHDGAEYVPKPLFEYWKKRDPIARLEDYLVKQEKVADGGGKRKANRGRRAAVGSGPGTCGEFSDADARIGRRRSVLRSWMPRDQAQVRDAWVSEDWVRENWYAQRKTGRSEAVGSGGASEVGPVPLRRAWAM